MVDRLVMLKKTFVLSAGLLLGGLLMIGESGAANSALTQTHSGGGVTVDATYLNPFSDSHAST